MLNIPKVGYKWWHPLRCNYFISKCLKIKNNDDNKKKKNDIKLWVLEVTFSNGGYLNSECISVGVGLLLMCLLTHHLLRDSTIPVCACICMNLNPEQVGNEHSASHQIVLLCQQCALCSFPSSDKYWLYCLGAYKLKWVVFSFNPKSSLGHRLLVMNRLTQR